MLASVNRGGDPPEPLGLLPSGRADQRGGEDALLQERDLTDRRMEQGWQQSAACVGKSFLFFF